MAFRVVMKSWGGTKETLFDGLSEDDAVEICDFYNWEYSPDGGYVWDLEIEEYDGEIVPDDWYEPDIKFYTSANPWDAPGMSLKDFF